MADDIIAIATISNDNMLHMRNCRERRLPLFDNRLRRADILALCVP